MNGLKIKEIMRSHGISLRAAAELLGESSQNMSSLLSKDDIRTGLVERISAATGIPLAELYGVEVSALKSAIDDPTKGRHEVVGRGEGIASMSESDVKQLRANLNLSQEAFAKLAGVHPRTVQNWESGGVIPQSKCALLRSIGNVSLSASDNSAQLMALVVSQQQSLSKAQEQIDKLLDIIENFAKE